MNDASLRYAKLEAVGPPSGDMDKSYGFAVRRDRNTMSNLRLNVVLFLSILLAVILSACGSGSSASAPAIDVGGYQLAYQCAGQGSPTVIVEAGMDDAPSLSSGWLHVVDQVETTTRICIYDRAGLGGSGRAPIPRTSMDIAEDLHVLLSEVPLPGPYIFVAHSIGGFHVRVYADLYPEDVAGVILVDCSHPDQFALGAEAYPTASPNEEPALTSNRPFFQDGPQASDTAEGLDPLTSADQVRNTGSFGTIPLIVISQSANPDNWNIAGFSEEDKQRFLDLRLRLQAELALLSSNSTHITAEAAGHNIHLEEPQLIIDSIAQMVDELRDD
jgi:pimeloyl-ACP methyl ester carboxylesterase